MRSGPTCWFQLYLGSAGMGTRDPPVQMLRPAGPGGAAWPDAVLATRSSADTCHTRSCAAAPRDLRRVLSVLPGAEHIRGRRPLTPVPPLPRGTRAALGFHSPTRGSPLPFLSATQPHPDIAKIRLRWSSPLVPFSSRPARPSPLSGPVGPRAPARWDASRAGPAPAGVRGSRSPFFWSPRRTRPAGSAPCALGSVTFS